MHAWQLLPFVLLVGVGAWVLFARGRMGQMAATLYGEAMAQLSAECADQRRPTESEAITVIALSRSLLRARVFYLGLTNQRLFVKEAPSPPRAFDRDASLALTIAKKRFADVGNMQTTFTSGWEARVALPNGEAHVWRLYDAWTGYEDQARNLDAFLRAAGAA